MSSAPLVLVGALIGAVAVASGYLLLRKRVSLRRIGSGAQQLGADVWTETARIRKRYTASFIGGVTGALIAGVTVQSVNGWSLDQARERIELERTLLANSGLRVITGPGGLGRVLVLTGATEAPKVVQCPTTWANQSATEDICLIIDRVSQ